MQDYELNHRAADHVAALRDDLDDLRIDFHLLPNGAGVVDFGVEVRGGLSAGLELADVCLGGLADVMITTSMIDTGAAPAPEPWPHVTVATDHPVAACLLSQYAGYAVQAEGYFAMGSGPMRAAIAREDLFETLKYREQPEAAVGVLEASQLPTEAVATGLAERAGIEPANLALLVAPVTSVAGTIQVVARSVETGLHQLLEKGFDLSRIVSGWGTCPLPPVAADNLAGIARTNDAIISAAHIGLWVTGDDDSLREIGPQVVASHAESFGQSFLEIFEAAGQDFYAIDPGVFAPAVVTFHNVETGTLHRFGRSHGDLLRSCLGFGA